VDTTLGEQRAIAQHDERTRPQRAVVVAWNGIVPPDIAGRNELPDTLPLGYHHTDHALIISAPWRAAPITRRPQRRLRADLRAGDITAPRRGATSPRFGNSSTGYMPRGGDTVLTLPLLATFPDVASPYSPISRLFLRTNCTYLVPARHRRLRQLHR
jgi:hypothetical protein